MAMETKGKGRKGNVNRGKEKLREGEREEVKGRGKKG